MVRCQGHEVWHTPASVSALTPVSRGRRYVWSDELHVTRFVPVKATPSLTPCCTAAHPPLYDNQKLQKVYRAFPNIHKVRYAWIVSQPHLARVGLCCSIHTMLRGRGGH